MALDYIDPVMSATVKVLEMMTGQTVQPGAPAPFAPPAVRSGVAGAIPFFGEVNGVITLVMPDAYLLRVTGALTGTAPRSVDGDALDTMGELVNIICGETRRQYAEHGYELTAGLPELWQGRVLPPQGADFATEVPFTARDGSTFSVVLTVHGNGDRSGGTTPASARPVRLFRYSPP